MKNFDKRNIRALFFPELFIFMEIAFHIYHYGSVDQYLIFASLFAISFGFLVSTLTGFFSRKANIFIAWIVTIGTSIFFGLQMVYGHIFTKFITLSSVVENAGDATEFWKQALHGIWECLPGLILVLVIPIVLVAVCIKIKFICIPNEKKKSFIYQGV